MSFLVIGIAYLAFVLGGLLSAFMTDKSGGWQSAVLVLYIVMAVAGLFMLGFGLARVLS